MYVKQVQTRSQFLELDSCTKNFLPVMAVGKAVVSKQRGGLFNLCRVSKSKVVVTYRAINIRKEIRVEGG